MENVKPSAASVAIKWAVINILVSIVLTYVYQFAGLPELSPVRYITLIPLIAFLCMAQNEFKGKLGGFMTYGQGFLTGFLFGLFAAIFGAIFWYIYFRILTPTAFDQLLAETQAQMSAKNMPEDQVEVAMNFYRNWGGLIFPLVSIIFGVFLSTIISLITAAIFKKERSILDLEQNNN